jgi:hypothetical protein
MLLKTGSQFKGIRSVHYLSFKPSLSAKNLTRRVVSNLKGYKNITNGGHILLQVTLITISLDFFWKIIQIDLATRQ